MTARTAPMRGWLRNANSDGRSTGWPARDRYCLAMSPPKRVPRPAATTSAAMSIIARTLVQGGFRQQRRNDAIVRPHVERRALEPAGAVRAAAGYLAVLAGRRAQHPLLGSAGTRRHRPLALGLPADRRCLAHRIVGLALGHHRRPHAAVRPAGAGAAGRVALDLLAAALPPCAVLS